MTSRAAEVASPVVLGPGRWTRHGVRVPIVADALSWRADAFAGRWENLNTYTADHPDGGVVVDAGPAVFTQAFASRQGVLRPDVASPLTLMQTRIEPDVLSGLPDWVGEFGQETIRILAPGAGGLAPLDMFEDLNSRLLLEQLDVEVTFLHHGDRVPMGDGFLDVITPLFRTLSTRWIHDPATRTLFTSDAFSHYCGHGDGVVDEGNEHDFLPGGLDLRTCMRIHHLEKFDWLAGADLDPIARQITEIFAEREVDRICPSRGGIIEGAALVKRNAAALVEMFDTLAADQGSAA